jgi:hypothetical protein
MWGISWPAELLLASQEDVCLIELTVSKFLSMKLIYYSEWDPHVATGDGNRGILMRDLQPKPLESRQGADGWGPGYSRVI